MSFGLGSVLVLPLSSSLGDRSIGGGLWLEIVKEKCRAAEFHRGDGVGGFLLSGGVPLAEGGNGGSEPRSDSGWVSVLHGGATADADRGAG